MFIELNRTDTDQPVCINITHIASYMPFDGDEARAIVVTSVPNGNGSGMAWHTTSAKLTMRSTFRY